MACQFPCKTSQPSPGEKSNPNFPGGNYQMGREQWRKKKKKKKKKEAAANKTGPISEGETRWSGEIGFKTSYTELHAKTATKKPFFPRSKTTRWQTHGSVEVNGEVWIIWLIPRRQMDDLVWYLAFFCWNFEFEFHPILGDKVARATPYPHLYMLRHTYKCSIPHIWRLTCVKNT